MTAETRPTRAASPALWMLCGAFAFAMMGGLTHALGPRCDWLVVALVRALFMFTTTAILATVAGARLVVFRPRTLWVRSLAGSFSLVCNFYAMARLPVADAFTLSNAYPLWIVLATALLLRQSPTLAEWLGVACGLLGVVLIQQPHLGGDRFAAGVSLVSSVSTAVAMLGLHRLKQIDPRAVVCHFAGVASLVGLTWLLFRPDALSPRILTPATLAMLLGVGVSGTFGQYCLTRAYTSGRPAAIAVVSLTQVVFAMSLDVVFWGRSLSSVTLGGFALLLLPSAWLSIRSARKASSPAIIETRSEPRRGRAIEAA